MSLALRMGRTLGELRRCMPAAEYAAWLAYFQVLDEKQSGAESEENRLARQESEHIRMVHFFKSHGIPVTHG